MKFLLVKYRTGQKKCGKEESVVERTAVANCVTMIGLLYDGDVPFAGVFVA